MSPKLIQSYCNSNSCGTYMSTNYKKNHNLLFQVRYERYDGRQLEISLHGYKEQEETMIIVLRINSLYTSYHQKFISY